MHTLYVDFLRPRPPLLHTYPSPNFIISNIQLSLHGFVLAIKDKIFIWPK